MRRTISPEAIIQVRSWRPFRSIHFILSVHMLQLVIQLVIIFPNILSVFTGCIFPACYPFVQDVMQIFLLSKFAVEARSLLLNFCYRVFDGPLLSQSTRWVQGTFLVVFWTILILSGGYGAIKIRFENFQTIAAFTTVPKRNNLRHYTHTHHLVRVVAYLV